MLVHCIKSIFEKSKTITKLSYLRTEFFLIEFIKIINLENICEWKLTLDTVRIPVIINGLSKVKLNLVQNVRLQFHVSLKR